MVHVRRTRKARGTMRCEKIENFLSQVFDERSDGGSVDLLKVLDEVVAQVQETQAAVSGKWQRLTAC